MAEGGYVIPQGGWTCFCCGETFTTYGAARDHFGVDPFQDQQACRIKLGGERGLVMALRKAEEEAAKAWAAVHDENTEMHKVLRSMAARHADALEAAEEVGYQRGFHAGERHARQAAAS